jgi:hypothetical protein
MAVLFAGCDVLWSSTPCAFLRHLRRRVCATLLRIGDVLVVRVCRVPRRSHRSRRAPEPLQGRTAPGANAHYRRRCVGATIATS